ncbi:MAG: FAD:protein FMN transferase [Ilumatobacteraceae bacterium]|nr:FAD:protein FMN transferase [Ilumatobacteraceae bacterium]
MSSASTTTARVERIAMGVTCVVTVVGSNSHEIALHCLDLVEELESLWSRFIPTSDISRLNIANGQPTVVDERTLTLIHHMIAAHQATDGAYNPTRLPLQIAAGDAHSLINDRNTELATDSIVFPQLSGIHIFHDGKVSLPRGMTLDAGGIGKGLAADLILRVALEQGADGACINLGGDMAINTGDSIGWDVEILSPFDPGVILDTVRVSVGGVATSSLFARQRNSAGIASHLFSDSSAHDTQHTVGATVIANSAAWSEAWTKYAILSNPAQAIDTLTSTGLAALLVSADGHTTRSESWKTFTND